MTSLYGQYIAEREGFEIVERPGGFATFKVSGDECYLRDVFVLPAVRRGKTASRMVDSVREIAQKKGAAFLVTTVCPSAVGSTESLKAILSYGFRLHSAQNDFIVFRMDI